MSSPGQGELQQATSDTERLMGRAYGIAIPAMRTEYGAINQALALGGEPDYLKGAYAEERTGLLDRASSGEAADIAKMGRATEGATYGGNVGASLSPLAVGRSLADVLYGSRVNEAAGKVEEINKLYGLGVGQAAQAGSAAAGAESARAGYATMMPQYNSTYANILGALNLGSTIYGAWPSGLQQIPQGQSFASFASAQPSVG